LVPVTFVIADVDIVSVSAGRGIKAIAASLIVSPAAHDERVVSITDRVDDEAG
jgi:hypothetical protein